jgi:hypothetical protein
MGQSNRFESWQRSRTLAQTLPRGHVTGKNTRDVTILSSAATRNKLGVVFQEPEA